MWRRALGELLTVRLALDGDEIVGGICYERYPRCGCGLVTYMVIAPGTRGQGLGERLLREAVQALYDGGAPAVFGEVVDSSAPTARHRLERFKRWGARVVDARYVQPSLGPGLDRDASLLLLVLAGAAAVPGELPGEIVRSFIEELYAVTEGGLPDERIVVPEVVRLLA